MTEAKLCPFCGEKPTTWFYSGADGDKEVAQCINCDCPMYEQDTMYIEAWNRRPLEDAALARAEKAEKERDAALAQAEQADAATAIAMHNEAIAKSCLATAEKERDKWHQAASQLWPYSHHNKFCDFVCIDDAVCNCGYEQVDDDFLALVAAHHALTKGQQP